MRFTVILLGLLLSGCGSTAFLTNSENTKVVVVSHTVSGGGGMSGMVSGDTQVETCSVKVNGEDTILPDVDFEAGVHCKAISQ